MESGSGFRVGLGHVLALTALGNAPLFSLFFILFDFFMFFLFCIYFLVPCYFVLLGFFFGFSSIYFSI